MSSRAAPAATETSRRPYSSARRSLQAAQTREDVLAAAIRLFTTSGWAGTTVTGIASEAGVAVETVYSGFGSKKGLLRAALDVAVVGDAQPVPFVERDEFHRLGRGALAERMQAGVTVQADIHERSAGVWRAITEAAAADAEVENWRIELERGRRVDLERSAKVVLNRDLDARTLDWLWVVLGPEVYLKLTVDAGLARADYEAYILDVFERLISPAMKRSRVSRKGSVSAENAAER